MYCCGKAVLDTEPVVSFAAGAAGSAGVGMATGGEGGGGRACESVAAKASLDAYRGDLGDERLFQSGTFREE